MVRRVARLVDLAEYKRRQAPRAEAAAARVRPRPPRTDHERLPLSSARSGDLGPMQETFRAMIAGDRRRDRGDRRDAAVRRARPSARGRLQKISSGTSANGMPNDSTTCDSTSAAEALTPSASTSSAGAIVIARRTKSGIWRRMKPCITTWPASVPTDDDDSPDASRAIPKTTSACGRGAAERRRRRPAGRRRRSMPRAWNTAAAIISMAMLTNPAMPIAITTSTRSKRKIPRLRPRWRGDDAVLRERRVQVDHVRHHRRAEDAGRQQHASMPANRGVNRPCRDARGTGRPGTPGRRSRSRSRRPGRR